MEQVTEYREVNFDNWFMANEFRSTSYKIKKKKLLWLEYYHMEIGNSMMYLDRINSFLAR